ncbi:5-oxoprolinase subunit PxpA [Nocardioides sp. Bht2]|uniref:5-oxoprolinase subunit PxpA n=1 Tax=Nocardioides sp. Bht2 TaxID=3392297 RepID=UPI0039B6BB58
MRQIDVNADLGEEITDDEGLLQVVSSANLACGFHAGNPAIMRQVCDRAAELGVAVGAQVSYHDREHFGRRRLDVPAPVLAQQVADQVGLLTEIARAAGIEVSYLKPHGALYNRVVEDAEQAGAVLAGSGELPVLGLPGGVFLELAQASNRASWREGFPDRGYTSHGRLVPRDEPGALITAEPEIVLGALRLAEQVDSLCLHGDSPGAVAHARAVRAALAADGFSIRPFSTGD